MRSTQNINICCGSAEPVPLTRNILPVTSKDVESRIVIVRGQHVLLDRDVAELYGVETKRINEAVKNNPEKFPPRCIIYLDEEESAVLRSKFSTIEPSQGKGHYSKYNFKAFTERGLYMLATILKSPRATRPPSPSSTPSLKCVRWPAPWKPSRTSSTAAPSSSPSSRRQASSLPLS